MNASLRPGIQGNLYRTFWRWHFYAGLFVLPFVLVLALSGTVFLFKPQVDRWEERDFRGFPTADVVSPAEQVQSALASFPGARFHSYRVPGQADHAALVHLALLGDGGMRDVFVSPQGTVLGSFNASTRVIEVARRIHGQLLMGRAGSWLVELVACWALVMVITGLYLWWPRGRGPAGVLWPRRRTLLRDLHAVAGFWISAFVLVLLVTGLPWTDVWGRAFQTVRDSAGWVKGAPSWNIAGSAAAAPQAHASHDHGSMHSGDTNASAPPDAHAHAHADAGADADASAHTSAHPQLARLDDLVAHARQEAMAFPTMVLAPGEVLFAPPSSEWTVTSQTQNRPLGLTITYDAQDGSERSREAFADRHVIDRVVGYGLAWHEGALFGAINQLVGLITTLALVTMSVTGFLMWRRRRPANQLGAPPMPAAAGKPVFVTMVILVLALLLPLLAASLLLLWLLDRLLPRLHPGVAAWLGLARTAPRGDTF